MLESNENNNAVTKTVTVNGPLPDLTIDSISLSPDTPKVGDTITFTATIKNTGPGASPASKLNYKIIENNETVSSSDYTRILNLQQVKPHKVLFPGLLRMKGI